MFKALFLIAAFLIAYASTRATPIAIASPIAKAQYNGYLGQLEHDLANVERDILILEGRSNYGVGGLGGGYNTGYNGYNTGYNTGYSGYNTGYGSNPYGGYSSYYG